MKFEDLTDEQQARALELGYCGLFSNRDTIEEALAYTYKFRDPHVTTAVHVLLNTITLKVATGEFK